MSYLTMKDHSHPEKISQAPSASEGRRGAIITYDERQKIKQKPQPKKGPQIEQIKCYEGEAPIDTQKAEAVIKIQQERLEKAEEEKIHPDYRAGKRNPRKVLL